MEFSIRVACVAASICFSEFVPKIDALPQCDNSLCAERSTVAVLVAMNAMENPNHIFTGLQTGTDVRIHRSAPAKPSTSRASRMYEEEKIDIYTDETIEMEDIGKDATNKNIDTTAETLEDRLFINSHELQNIFYEPNALPEYIKSLGPTDDIFQTFEDKDLNTNKTSLTKWVSFSKKARDGRSCTLGSLWMWRILCLILAVTIAILLIFTKRPVHNHYHIYH